MLKCIVNTIDTTIIFIFNFVWIFFIYVFIYIISYGNFFSCRYFFRLIFLILSEIYIVDLYYIHFQDIDIWSNDKCFCLFLFSFVTHMVFSSLYIIIISKHLKNMYHNKYYLSMMSIFFWFVQSFFLWHAQHGKRYHHIDTSTKLCIIHYDQVYSI